MTYISGGSDPIFKVITKAAKTSTYTGVVAVRAELHNVGQRSASAPTHAAPLAVLQPPLYSWPNSIT